jgi:quinol-cytochrome oxidoreductase complex cytochrome b subunit
MKEQILRRIKVLNIIHEHLIYYPTTINLNYLWGFGSLAGIVLVLQILTGVFLAMHYTPHVTLAFESVEHIMRDVNNGWFLRYVHSNGASMFFVVLYLHIGRGLYFGSYKYPRTLLWISGVVLFFLIMATAFMGYVLPWGQMSFWGATVITNLATAIPFIGEDIAQWLWGGYAIDNATLNRFFSLHYLVPFLIAGVSLVHLVLLHMEGSSNPLGIDNSYKIPFYPYFYLKDLFGLCLMGLFFSFFVFFAPNVLGHSDNYIVANALVTPTHIVPEWYFLPFYAILRSIPSKGLGVFMMIFSIILLVFLPLLDDSFFRSGRFRPLFKISFWIFIFNFVLLGWIGAKPVEEPFTHIGLFALHIHLFYFFIFPEINNIEEMSVE